MSKSIFLIFLSSFVWFMGCAQTRYGWHAELEVPDDSWVAEIEAMRGLDDDYPLMARVSGESPRVFDRVSDQGVCFSPRRVGDRASSKRGFLSLTCSKLEGNRREALEAAISSYESSILLEKEGESEGDLKRRVLAMSDAVHPVCFSVFPEILSTELGRLRLQESWLLACAGAIEGDSAGNFVPSSNLARWLRAAAALLSQNEGFVASQFRQMFDEVSAEGLVYARALEGRLERRDGKWVQAELTFAEVLEKSEAYGMWFLNRHAAMALYEAILHDSNLQGAHFARMLRVISPYRRAPDEGTLSALPAMIFEMRRELLFNLCHQSILVPDLPAEASSTCLPWFEDVAQRHPENLEMVYLVIERSLSSLKGQPWDRVPEAVRAWLVEHWDARFLFYFPELSAH